MNAFQWGVVALAAIAAGIAFGSAVAFAVGIGLAGIGILALLTSGTIAKGLKVVRDVDRSLVPVGTPIQVRLWVGSSVRAVGRWILVRDAVPVGGQTKGAIGRIFFGTGGESNFAYGITLPIRGAYLLGPLTVTSGDVFSARVTSEKFEGAHEVLVHPKVLPVPTFDVRSLRPFGDDPTSARTAEDPTRPSGTRAYVAGDPLKRVHWRATAHAGTLMSRVYDPSSDLALMIIPNLFRGDYRDEEFAELAMTAAASVFAAALRDGRRVGLLTEGLLSSENGELHLERGMAALARAEFGEVPFSDCLLTNRTSLPWRATLLVVTQGLDPSAAAIIEILRQQGFAVAAVLVGEMLDVAPALERLAVLGAPTAHIEREEDLAHVHFIDPQRG